MGRDHDIFLSCSFSLSDNSTIISISGSLFPLNVGVPRTSLWSCFYYIHSLFTHTQSWVRSFTHRFPSTGLQPNPFSWDSDLYNCQTLVLCLGRCQDQCFHWVLGPSTKSRVASVRASAGGPLGFVLSLFGAMTEETRSFLGKKDVQSGRRNKHKYLQCNNLTLLVCKKPRLPHLALLEPFPWGPYPILIT